LNFNAFVVCKAKLHQFMTFIFMFYSRPRHSWMYTTLHCQQWVSRSSVFCAVRGCVLYSSYSYFW